MTGLYSYGELQRKREEALDLARRAQRERALAYSDLTDAKGTIRELQADLRDARLDLALARELLAYHDLTIEEETP